MYDSDRLIVRTVDYRNAIDDDENRYDAISTDENLRLRLRFSPPNLVPGLAWEIGCRKRGLKSNMGFHVCQSVVFTKVVYFFGQVDHRSR